MKPKHVMSETPQQKFEITLLSDGVFDIKISENIEETTEPQCKRDTANEPENVKVYKHDLYTAVVRAKDYGSFIAGVLHIKYSSDDENALINKGIADKNNAEYKAYREFVEAIKAEAIKYFDNE